MPTQAPRFPSQANVKLLHLVQSIVFFILALNAIGLLYLVTDSKNIFATLRAARISKMLDKVEARPEGPAEAAQTEPTPEPIAAAGLDVGPSSPAKPLTMQPVAPISATGACLAIENFKSPIQAQSAKALLATSPLANKSWVVSTPFPASYLAGVSTANATEARQVAKALSDRGVEPLSVSAQFVGLAKSDTEAAALELAGVAAGDGGLSLAVRVLATASERRSIVTLPQTRLEAQFASTLSARLPGVTLTPVPCPSIAAPYLGVRS